MTTRLIDSPDAQYAYYLVIPHVTEPRVLLTISGVNWTLPNYRPSEHNFGRVQHINRHLWANFGLHAATLRCLRSITFVDGRVERYFAIDNLDPNWQPPRAAHWFSEAELEDLALGQQTSRVLDEWFATLGSTPTARAPWGQPGWFNWAADTLVDMADRLEMIGIAEVEQIRLWTRSCTLRLRSNKGDLYLKAVPDSLSYEPIVTRVLSIRYPNYVPDVRAVHVDEGWLLMGDFGSNYLSHMDDYSVWEQVIRRYAQIQVDMVKHAQSLNSLGVPNRHLDYIASQVPRIVYDPADHLDSFEKRELKRHAANLRTMLFDLGEYKIPLSLAHGDLRPGNIIVQANGDPLFFDWADSAISHPFFDLPPLLAQLPPALNQTPDVRERLRDVYLEYWTQYEPLPNLHKAYRVVRVLAYLHQALIYQALVLPNTEASARWEVWPTLLRLVRQMLQELREQDY